MRFAIDLPISGQYADPRLLGELARDAENAGWDGCFIWDHLQVSNAEPLVDPWIALATMAVMTERISIGPMVTPLFRRRPWKLARESVSLDHLSRGRLTLGVGLGSDLFKEITTFGGPLADKDRAEMLDEGLAVLLGLWSGEEFAFRGPLFSGKGNALFTATAADSADSDLGRGHMAQKTTLAPSGAFRRDHRCRRKFELYIESGGGKRSDRLRSAVSNR